MSRNLEVYPLYGITLISFVLYATIDLSNAQSNITTPDTLNITTPDTLDITTSDKHTNTPNPSSSITEAVNDVLSGSVDGMIGETVDLLSRDTAKLNANSASGPVEHELPLSLAVGNNQTLVQENSIPKAPGNATNNVINLTAQIQTNNETASDSVNLLEQTLRKSTYDSSIAQSLDNNTFTNLKDQNVFGKLAYKIINLTEIDLFK